MITPDTWFQGNEGAVYTKGGLDSPFHHKERRFPQVCDNSANLSITGVGQLEIADGIVSEGVDAQADKVCDQHQTCHREELKTSRAKIRGRIS